ncbi:Serine carboxypeptidase-like 34 [Zea mays]|uniref:Carboxypeptidase n=1 Tax=Zea mays TaxID=4577 RepID=A0A317YGI4_MAIZE|nr:Serine carboxypeptidase-like 34 [Zea mays]
MNNMKKAVNTLLSWLLLLGTLTLAARPDAGGGLDAATVAAQELDRVLSLPGQPSYSSASPRQYSGYVTTDEHLGKALFYWFFEATDTPDEKPLVLWLNGGPGCSSIGFGQSQELGPFLVKKDVPELELNPCQSAVPGLPSGRRVFLHKHILRKGSTGRQFHRWFQRFPQHKAKEFYIAGESYAGHYVPQLADVIVEGNKKASEENHINFKGILIGNAYMDGDTDLVGIFDSAWHHAIISDELYGDVQKNCDFSLVELSPECSEDVDQYTALYRVIDIYSLYTDRCELGYPDFNYSVSPKTARGASRRRGRTYATEYFNREDVQKALHANVTGVPYPYSLCRGDTDARIPTTSTRYTLKKLGLPIKEDWSPWFHRKQVLVKPQRAADQQVQ